MAFGALSGAQFFVAKDSAGSRMPFARETDAGIIAEGVETHSQLAFLQRQGCGEGQGYYFSRPLVAEQAGNLFRTGLRQGLVN